MSETLSDWMLGRIGRLSQPSPWISLYEIEVPDSTYLRYVDYFDQDLPGTVAGKLTFDGHEYTPMHITRGELGEDAEAGRSELTLSIVDPLHEAAYFLSAHGGLVDQPVKMWLTTLDNVSNPADALLVNFRIISSFVTVAPDSVHLVLGHYNLFEARFPRLFYDRRLCFNNFERRFDLTNFCRYPSNEFGPQTAQDYTVGICLGERQRLFGWWTQGADRALIFDAHMTNAGRMTILSDSPWVAWSHQLRHGPYLYRWIDGDFDVETYVPSISVARSGWGFGLLLQDGCAAAPDPSEENPPEAPKSSWMLFGLRDDGAEGRELFYRKTIEDVSEDWDTAIEQYRYRMTRAGSTVTMYSKAAEGDAWTQRAQTTLSLSTSLVRIGVAITNEQQLSQEFGANFEFLRFASGGLTVCLRSREDCLLHANSHQFNGFPEIPSDRARL